MTTPLSQRLDVDPYLDKLELRGSKLRGEIAQLVTNASVSLAVDAVTQVRVEMADPGLVVAQSGLVVRGTNVTYQDLELVVASVELGPGPSGTGGLSFEARSKIVEDLKNRRGPMVLRDVSPSQFVTQECNAVRAKRVVAQPTGTRAQISRDVPVAGEKPAVGADRPSSWSTFQRLAKEVGFYVFEYAGVVFFGEPTWLIQNNPPDVTTGWLEINEPYKTLTVPTCRASNDAENAVEIQLELPYTRALEARPGRALRLLGVPGFAGRYMIKSVDFALAGQGPVSVTAVTPVDPEPEPPPVGTSMNTTGATEIGGQGRYKRVVDAAIAAGFRGDALVIAVAVAIAESGGDARATNRNSNGSVDYGLWQINSIHRASGFDPSQAFEPHYNARWAYKISKNGTNWSPWVAFKNGRYKQFLADAKSSINYGGTAQEGSSGPATASGSKSALDFVTVCLTQAGDPYVFGAEASGSDPNPRAFDCSELIEWACARVGVKFVDGSVNQINACARAGREIPLAQGIRTRGAVLFRRGNPNHIAVSLGDGRTIEARGRAYGVGSFQATGRFERAGLIPGLRYG